MLKDLRNPSGTQSKNEINEFFELLKCLNIAEVIED